MKITYLFVNGRIDRINKINNFAKEMFYGYDHFSKKYETSIIELQTQNKIFNKIFYFVDRVVNKLTKLPFNMNSISSKKNLNHFFNSDHIIASNDRVALSSLPMLLVCKILRKKVKFSFFIMGLFDYRNRTFLQKKIAKLLIILLIRNSNNLIFLGIKEYEIASENFNKYKNKFHYLPFMVDTKFWQSKKVGVEKRNILFVGNDTNREFKKVIKIASILKDIKFIIVSKHYRINNIDVNLPNVEIIDGSWGNQRLTDDELKDLYNKSKLVIIPLKESVQPSGQSVTLQSMAMSTPVMITKTDGFWDNNEFNHLENIYFIENNSLDNWVRSINEIYYDTKILKNLSINGLKVINNKYKSEYFIEKLENILKI
tara:strand:- start:1743 stop:2855 length:1113 start_codon:yes stop_codon:yes gene_type:complete